jgi:type I restriction enzyme S subunit
LKNLQATAIAELAEVKSGNGAPQDPSAFSTDGHPFVRAGSLSGLIKGGDESTLERIAPDVARAHRLTLFPRGTVLFAKSGMSATKGYIYSLKQPAYVVNHLAALLPRDSRDSAFLTKALERFSPTSLIKDQAYPSIRLGDIEQMQILAPCSIEGRLRIASILEKADALRRKRKRALDLLDSLTQSIFLNMFGDPGSNPNEWPGAKLGDVLRKASDGPHVSPVYSEEGVPFLSTRHISIEGIVWNDLKYIDREQANAHWKKCRPEKGDLLYSKGGTTGIATMIDTDRDFAIWVHLALLKPDFSKIDPLWLACMLNSEYCYRQSQRYTHGIANRDLGLKRMINIKLYLPPLSKQNEFSRAAFRVRNLRKCVLRSFEIEQTLFSSLQHRAFSGQL